MKMSKPFVVVTNPLPRGRKKRKLVHLLCAETKTPLQILKRKENVQSALLQISVCKLVQRGDLAGRRVKGKIPISPKPAVAAAAAPPPPGAQAGGRLRPHSSPEISDGIPRTALQCLHFQSFIYTMKNFR